MRFSILVTLLFSNFIFGQLSNKHWLPPLHAKEASIVNDHYIYLSTPSPTPFSVSIKTGNGTPIQGSPFTISQGNPQTIFIGNGQPSAMFLNQNDVNIVKSNKGLILEGNKDFYVTFRVRSQNHAEVLVSKGIPGIGLNFRVGSVPQGGDGSIRNFVSSFMATEDNTTVAVSDYNNNVVFTSGTGDITLDSQNFTLNKGESVVLSGYTDFTANFDGFIGALISSDKPIAVSTGNALGGTLTATDGQDFNLDQIVSYDQIGSEYIVVRGNGGDDSEFPLVIATEDNTEIYINGSATPYSTINTGGYLIVPPTFYQGSGNHKNMYITSSKPIYLYQVLAGANNPATTGLNFIPPLSCFFQKSVDLIPSINSIGNTTYTGDIIALTYATATITVNGNSITALPENVLGNPDWVSYKITGYTGNVVVESTGPLAVGVFGASGAAGYGGYYSGFGTEPRDTQVTLCSGQTTNLLDAIDGNPETGGTWTPPLASGTDIFDPNIDTVGTYNYSYVADCANISVDITVVAIQQAPFAGNNALLTVCDNDSPVDLFGLLGNNVTTGGTWSPALSSSSSIYNPAFDAAGVYTYTIEGNEVCEEISTTVTITKNNSPTISSITDLVICDDNNDSNDTNGLATFNLPSKTAEILNGQTGVTVTYHINQNDAINNTNPQTNYYSNSQLVYVRLTNNTTNCFATTSFNLVVSPVPAVNAVVNLKQCDVDTDAITDFNLTFAEPLISSDNTLSFTYFTSQNDAENNSNQIANIQNYTAANNSVIWAKVVNQNNCYKVVKVNLIVSTTTPVNVIEMTECDVFIDSNDPANDGYHYFNLNNATTHILSQFPSNQNLQVSYYDNEANATAGINSITNLTNYRNTVQGMQLIWVRIDSAINNECFGLGQFLKLIVSPIPNFDLGADTTLCVDATTGTVSYSINATPITPGNYSYNWTPSNPSLDANGNQSPIYVISQEGNYAVTVTNTITTCSNTDTITISYSSEPKSVTATLITPFFSAGLASIEAIPAGGYGTYEYSIDNGANWQNSPVFVGLTNGTYTVLVRDINQCGLVQSQSIRTVTYPAYFTPNGDGYNEYWNINGLLQSYNAKIYIFDRYGKFLKELKPNNGGWDGTYNGQPLPATDYWFKIEYTENDIRKEFKSHFTLKR